MNDRPLSFHESDNLARLHEAGLPVSLLFVTRTGLAKSILDATEPMRRLFLASGMHDYSAQGQGESHKRTVPAAVFSGGQVHELSVSLYRPQTKRGDPRMWPSGFTRIAEPGEAFTVFVHRAKLHFLSLSRSLLGHDLDLGLTSSTETTLVAPLIRDANATAEELLARLRELAGKGPLKAVCGGSTAIGRTLESVLGIPMNSSKRPDYRGIELKSGRGALVGSESRVQLFCRVPDWSLSKFSSLQALVENCGYARHGELRLYCTVSSLRENPQGLVLRVQEGQPIGVLEEWSRRHRAQVVAWRLDDLETQLKAKHRETFWIKARATRRTDGEWFELLSATHTRNPVEGQLTRLLDSGSVTLDHMLSGALDSKTAHDHGPAFKLERARLGELFRSVPKEYDLQG